MTKEAAEEKLPRLLDSRQIKPLRQWGKRIRGGYIHEVLDQELRCSVLEMVSMRSSGTYITCPADPRKTLGIRAPYLCVTVKNLQRSFLVEFQVKDSNNVSRRFRATTKLTDAYVKPYTCKMPLSLESGWNQVVFPLKEYTMKVYGTRYMETLRVQIHATCRIQGVYFSSSPDSDNEVDGSGDHT